MCSPSAEHSRYVHSLGVLYIMGLMTEHLLKIGGISEEDAIKMRVAALLHDIGRYPLSHLGEAVYGYCKDSKNASSIYRGGDPKLAIFHIRYMSYLLHTQNRQIMSIWENIS